MARLIRTEKEVEGRYEEVWLVVEEDSLDQWPAGPLEIVGRDALRVDGRERATGQAVFTADLAKPGMLHTAVLRSPHPRARVSTHRPRAGARDAGRPRRDRPRRHRATDRRLLATRVRRSPPCAPTRSRRHAQRCVRSRASSRCSNRCSIPTRRFAEAHCSASRASARAATTSRGSQRQTSVVEAEFRTQVVLHNSMETHQAVVEWIGEGVEVHISTQYIWGVRDAVAEGLGLPADKVRVVCHYMGGGFGSKNGPDDYTFIAAELARRTHRPVKCALTRREENTAAGNRNATIQRLTVGARSDGTLTALGGEFVNAVGWSGWSAGTEGPMQMLYACPNVKTTTYGAKLNLPPMKAFRAPGFVEGTFGLEALLDELATKLDLDPLELRRRNHTDEAPEGNEYSGKNLLECYRRAEPHWERRHEVRARSTATVKRGVGMASQIWYGGGGPPSYAWIRVGSDGRATVVTAMQDIGTGTRTAMAQIAAEELGIPLEHVTVTLGDSDRGPYATLSAGSSTTPSVGPAVRAAAADAREQIEEIAEQRGMKGASVAEVVDVLEDAQILGKGARGPNPTGKQVLTFGVQVAEVAVDIETGEVWVERIAAVHDVGRVINPLGASSQIEGGIIQGIGHTLSEERLHDPATGRLLTTTLDAYKLPTIADVPEIVSELIDEPDMHLTNLGAKGLGEPPIIPTAAAIANAIRDATGADVRRLPISREEMLRALREAEARQKEKVGAPAGV